jgi:hypothetical protein
MPAQQLTAKQAADQQLVAQQVAAQQQWADQQAQAHESLSLQASQDTAVQAQTDNTPLSYPGIQSFNPQAYSNPFVATNIGNGVHSSLAPSFNYANANGSCVGLTHAGCSL